mmetsp:Transcript_1355/g.3707  ORF Transcript_1355/g.3707 Transcript_1355/m.3707 type:complete len:208 (+) Transcript_1355:152-775(+)
MCVCVCVCVCGMRWPAAVVTRCGSSGGVCAVVGGGTRLYAKRLRARARRGVCVCDADSAHCITTVEHPPVLASYSPVPSTSPTRRWFPPLPPSPHRALHHRYGDDGRLLRATRARARARAHTHTRAHTRTRGSARAEARSPDSETRRTLRREGKAAVEHGGSERAGVRACACACACMIGEAVGWTARYKARGLRVGMCTVRTARGVG